MPSTEAQRKTQALREASSLRGAQYPQYLCPPLPPIAHKHTCVSP